MSEKQTSLYVVVGSRLLTLDEHNRKKEYLRKYYKERYKNEEEFRKRSYRRCRRFNDFHAEIKRLGNIAIDSN